MMIIMMIITCQHAFFPEGDDHKLRSGFGGAIGWIDVTVDLQLKNLNTNVVLSCVFQTNT